MKKTCLAILIAMSVIFMILFSGCSDNSEANIATIQNGYLGEYTDITVKDLLSGYYTSMLYDDETWDGGTTDAGKEIVQVTFHDVDGDLDDVNIQFTMLAEQCFEVTAFVDPLQPVEQSTDLLTALNYIYFQQYLAGHPDIVGDHDAELAFITNLETISGSAVKYGASEQYEGERKKLCTLAGDTVLDVNVPMLLDSSGILDMSYYYTDRYIEIVQTGYLGEYTDVTVDELLSGHYGLMGYDEDTWESSTNSAGDVVVQATYHSADGDFDDVNLQFTMLDDSCFKVTAIDNPNAPVENATDLLAEISNMYYVFQQEALADDTAKQMEIIQKLSEIPASAAQYGASTDYEGDRSQIGNSFGEMPPINLNVVELLEDYEVLVSGSAANPDESFIGTWKSDSITLEITTRDKKGEYNVTLTAYPWPARYPTWTYEAKYNTKTGNLDCRNGIRIDHGKVASDTTIIYDGDGAAEILISDSGSLSFVSTSACPEDEDILPSPIIFRANNPAAVSEPPASSGLSQYYGYYSSENGLLQVALSEGSSKESFYMYIAYEPMFQLQDVHTDIKPNGEMVMTFFADELGSSDTIEKDLDSIAGGVSLEIQNDGTLHLFLRTSTTDWMEIDEDLVPADKFFLYYGF